MKFASFYDTRLLFVSVAIMVLGAHLIILSSMEFLSSLFLVVGAASVVSAMFFIMLNIRKRVI
ncbi:hypothetical protein IX51_06620 [uncultured archaeon]|nr:hypothetical protein IX51_06620 [uncultured archaeon]